MQGNILLTSPDRLSVTYFLLDNTKCDSFLSTVSQNPCSVPIALFCSSKRAGYVAPQDLASIPAHKCATICHLLSLMRFPILRMPTYSTKAMKARMNVSVCDTRSPANRAVIVLKISIYSSF